MAKNQKQSSDEQRLYAIGQAAQLAGVSRQSVQYYLMVGLIKPTVCTPTGRRLFDQQAIARIRLIKQLNQNGYPLRAIRDIFMQSPTEQGTCND